MTDYCSMNATDLIREIAKKAISPVEVMRASIERIEAVDPAVNAMVTRDFDRAMTQAKETETRIARGDDAGLLAGLPVGIKDLEETAGLRTTFGSVVFRDHIPASDSLAVATIKSHGGIVIGKTNTPEFGTGGNTWNDVFGATCNPFDTAKTPAGSSGGSAVALATGMVPLATGSDFGGSLRTPAGYCGVVGFRPSPGIVPDVDKEVGLAPFAVLGPMARNTADAILLLKAQMAVDERDPFSHPHIADIPAHPRPADIQGKRLALSADLGIAPVAANIRKTFTQRMEILAPAFGESTWHDPDFGGIHDCFEILRAVGYVAGFRNLVDKHRESLSPLLVDNVERGMGYGLHDVAMAHKIQTALARKWLALFREVDVVICPAAAVSPYPHAERFVADIDGEAMPTYMRWLALSYAPTMVMACSLVLPCGVDDRGLPFGIQLLGPPGGDGKLLEIGLAVEAEMARHPRCARPLPDLGSLQGQAS